MTPILALNVADWTQTPAYRYRKIGPCSGEEYRDTILIPALEKAEIVAVNLDGVVGYGSGWLSEVFEGLVEKLGPDVRERIRVTSSQFGYRVEQVSRWMQEAAERAQKVKP